MITTKAELTMASNTFAAQRCFALSSTPSSGLSSTYSSGLSSPSHHPFSSDTTRLGGASLERFGLNRSTDAPSTTSQCTRSRLPRKSHIFSLCLSDPLLGFCGDSLSLLFFSYFNHQEKSAKFFHTVEDPIPDAHIRRRGYSP